jgi:hypothetical protein
MGTFEHAGSIPIMPTTNPEIAVTFTPQEWAEEPSHLDAGANRQLVPAEDRDPVTFVVSWEGGTDEEGAVLPDKSYEANQLQTHPSAPEWVRDWEGPYYVRTEPIDDE